MGGDLPPSSRTRSSRLKPKPSPVGVPRASPISKNVGRPSRKSKSKANTSFKAGTSRVAKDLQPRDRSRLELFYRYLYRRMLVRIEMYPDTKTVLGSAAPPSSSVPDPILDLCTMGNAYRHLDSGDQQGHTWRTATPCTFHQVHC